MTFTDFQFRLVVACLKHCAMQFQDFALANAKGNMTQKIVAKQQADFAKACGALAIELEAQHERRPVGLILPKTIN